MSHSLLKYILVAALFFMIGLLIPRSPEENQPDVPDEPTQNRRSQLVNKRDSMNSRKITRPSSSTSHKPQTLNLQMEVIETLINTHGMNRMLPKMGLNEDQIKAVLEIEKSSFNRLKDLEAKHATLQSDEQGSYYAIEAFPEGLDEWMTETRQQLQDFVDDDLAMVISLLIAQFDSDGQTGNFRREVRIQESSSPGSAVRIKESVFDENGKRIDDDYFLYQGNQIARWEKLFELNEQ